MGKQAEGHAQKALDSPCAGAYQASLRCKCHRKASTNTQRWQHESAVSCCHIPDAVCAVHMQCMNQNCCTHAAGLEVNKYNRDKCQDAFIAYKECKKQEVHLVASCTGSPKFITPTFTFKPGSPISHIWLRIPDCELCSFELILKHGRPQDML